VVQWPWVSDGCSAGHQNYEGSFAADEVDQQLEERVDGESLPWLARCWIILWTEVLPHIHLGEDPHRRLP
jgi:hypothetical protein